MADEKSDDIVSLEDLLRDDPTPPAGGAPAASTPPPPNEAAKKDPTPAQPAPTMEGTEDIDKLLETADPEFAAQMKEITDLSAEGVTIDADIESAVERERKEAGIKGFKKIVLWAVTKPLRRFEILKTQLIGTAKWLKEDGLPLVIAGLKTGVARAKEGVAAGVGRIKAGIAWFKALPRKSKAILVAALALTIVTVFAIRLTLTDGGLFPDMDVDYLTSFAPVADQAYEIEKDEAWVDLNDPLLHPEHVVLIDRIISNLRSPGDGSNPMALIDLYVESASQDVAIELKNREAEARDTIGRTLLQMTYEELVTEPGKVKLKVFLRKNLNEVLTSGRVRRVYFKSIIVKP